MPVPHTSGAFADLVNKRVTKIFYDTYDQLPTMIPMVYGMETSSDQYETWSSVGSMGLHSQFTGSVTYGSQNQGYDVTATHLEWVSGLQIERALYDDDRHGIWERKPVALATSARRTREVHGARMYNLGFSVDTTFYNNSEAVALFSNSHTTTSGASTASGFDNLTTSSLSATSVAASRVQMVGFLDDQALRFETMPSAIIHPPDLYDIAFEIVESAGKPDTANNNRNVHEGKYRLIEWRYLTDANNWFMVDEDKMKMMLTWFDRVPVEFAFAEEIDTLIAKWRSYMRYSMLWSDWRFGLGAQVT